MQNNPQTTCTSTSGSLATVSEAVVITTVSSTLNPNTETTEYNNCSKKLKSYQDHTSINELI